MSPVPRQLVATLAVLTLNLSSSHSPAACWPGGMAPAGASPARQRPLDTSAPAAWKQEKLAQLEEGISAAERAGESDRHDELRARREWLRSWPAEPSAADAQASAPGWSPLSSDQIPWLVAEPDLTAHLHSYDIEREHAEGRREGNRWLRAAARLQAELHRLDAPPVRKQNLKRTAAQCERLVVALAEAPEPLPRGLTAEDVYWARAHTLYRWGRALGYRELPDVREVMPLENPTQLDQRLRGVFEQLRRLAPDRAEFVLLKIRMLRRDEQWGRALRLLEAHRWAIDRKWYLKKRRDMLASLGWEPAHARAAAEYASYLRQTGEAE